MFVRSSRLSAFALVCAGLPCIAGIVHAADRTALPPIGFSDPGLEQAALNATNAPNGFSYGPNPAGPLYGSGWVFNLASGVAKNGSAFNNPTTPEGNQVGLIQGADYSVISQQINPGAGRYRVSFIAAQRQLPVPDAQKIFLRVGGSDIFGMQPASSSWTAATSPAFDLPGSATTIAFHGDPANTTGQTGFLDDVRLLPANLINDGGFEQPAIPAVAPYFQYQGQFVGAIWSFAGGTGLARSNSAFDNGVAPQGNQVALLQSTGAVVSQTFAVNHAGRYRLTFKARQRVAGSNENRQTLRITIDSLDIGTITPTGSDYATFVFDAIRLPTGNHTLAFTGMDDNVPGGHTAFIDDVRLESVVANARRWSDGATWGSALPPQAGDDVTIPAGSIVLLDGNATARKLIVEGELHCADEDITLDVKSILVTGRFICGSPATPYEHRFVTTLSSLPSNEVGPMGEKFFAAMAPGVVELHGEDREGWTQIDGSLPAGANTLTLVSTVKWRQGDDIVIAPTNAAPNEAEVVHIDGVSRDGKTITFSPKLQYAHYGLQSSHTSTGAVPDTWTLDERAEVGLLTRNITIQGDASSSADSIGGHMMTMQGSTIHASGIELYRMGQHGRIGRYPFHWHRVGHAPGQYIRNSSIHESYHRCITVHGTHDTLVADNVCYDFSGHGYFLEDGMERNNEFVGNLGILGKKPGPGAVLPTDGRTATASNGPAVFWISNPNNFFVGNVAAGFYGSGFWYHTESKVTGESGPPADQPGFCANNPTSERCINPKLQPFGLFADNRAHSGVQGFSSCENESGREGLDAAGVLISGFTANNVNQGVWPCASNMVAMNSTFERLIVANAPNGMQSPSPVTIRHSLFLARSANEHPHAALSAETPFGGVYIYDQGFLLDNVHFKNYDRPLATALYSFGGAHKWTSNRSRGLSFSTDSNIFSELLSETSWYPQSQSWSDVVHDLDGSLVGTGYALVADRPLTWDASCRRPAQMKTFGYACPYHYAQVTLKTTNPPDADLEPVTVVRSDGATVGGPGPIPDAFVSAFIADGGYRHAYRYDHGLTQRNVWLSVNNAMPGESTVHEILDLPANFRLDPQMPSFSDWQAHSGPESAFFSGLGHRYLYRADRKALLIKTAPGGSSWFATDTVWICLDGNGAPLAPCSFGARAATPPAVTITSPDRVASGVTAVFTATVAPTAALKLFVDDVSGTTVVNGASLPYSASLPDGRYLVRVVAVPTVGDTYTALQTLTVGEPVPRIAITSHLENGTYLAASLPALAYQVLGTSGSPPHVHWLVNGVDQGEAGLGPVSLASLGQGRNDLQLAFANPDHSLSPLGDRRTIFVTVPDAAGDAIADFEDGLDPRTTFRGHGLNAQPEEMLYLYGRRATGRVDAFTPVGANGEDGQRMTTRYVDASLTRSRFRLDLKPAQDWSSYGQMKAYHNGPAYEAFLIYANGTEASLGTGNAGMYQQDYFSLAGKQKTQIVAIEVRQTQPNDGGCVVNDYIASSCETTQDLYYIKLLPP